MPQLGESIAEGTVVKWLIPQGGAVERDQPLLEVETEKVTLDIPSPATGFLTEVLVPEGETVPVGKLLARLDSQPPSGVVNRVGGGVVRPMGPAGRESARTRRPGSISSSSTAKTWKSCRRGKGTMGLFSKDALLGLD